MFFTKPAHFCSGSVPAAPSPEGSSAGSSSPVHRSQALMRPSRASSLERETPSTRLTPSSSSSSHVIRFLSSSPEKHVMRASFGSQPDP